MLLNFNNKSSLLLILIITFLLSSCVQKSENIVIRSFSKGTIDLNCVDSGYAILGSPGFSGNKKDYYYLGYKGGDSFVIKNEIPVFSVPGKLSSIYLYGESNHLVFDNVNNYYKDGIFQGKLITAFRPYTSNNNFAFDALSNIITKDGPLEVDGGISGKIFFSTDGTKIAYRKLESSGMVVYFGAQKYGPHNGAIDEHLMISPDGDWIAYRVIEGGEYSLFIDGQKVSGENEKSHLQFNTWYNDKFSYIVQKNGKDWLIYNGKIFPWNKNDWNSDIIKRLYLNKQPLIKPSNLMFSKNGSHVVYDDFEFVKQNGNSGINTFLIKDGKTIAKYLMNGEIKLVGGSLGNCGPQFIGDSLYYFERKGNSLVLLKDNEIINLGSDIISNKSMSCFSSVEGNFIFGHNEIPVVEVKISEYGDIALFEKDDKDNWSVYINGDKLNRQFRSWSTFQFGNKGMYGFFAKKDNESMIIREGGKCILSSSENLQEPGQRNYDNKTDFLYDKKLD